MSQYVWTKKAERDYRAKWGPEHPCKRKAGQLATYGGSTVIQSTIAKAYAERGWIKIVHEKEPAMDMRGRQRKMDEKKEQVYETRWKMLQYWMRQKNMDSIQQIAANMGFSGREVLRDFVKTHGERMAEKYGKLPYFTGGQGHELSVCWTRVMEAKA
jgi:hypothetical protein